MAYYHVCPNCGSNLDPGEHCNCQNYKEENSRKKGGEDFESHITAAGRILSRHNDRSIRVG